VEGAAPPRTKKAQKRRIVAHSEVAVRVRSARRMSTGFGDAREPRIESRREGGALTLTTTPREKKPEHPG
jgi:hypothetical protein